MKTAGALPGRRPWKPIVRLTQSEGALDNARTDKNQQLVLVIDFGVRTEQESDVGQVAKHRYLGRVVALSLLVYAADHDSAAVLYQHRSRDLFGVDRRAGRGYGAHAVLMHVEVHD